MRVIDRVLKVRQHHCAGPERPRYGVASWGKCSHSSSPSGAHDERIEVDPALDALRAPTRRLVGPAAAASVSVAARRAEESFIELEITLGDALAARPRAVRQH